MRETDALLARSNIDSRVNPRLCADVGAAASPVRPAAGRSLAPGLGAPLPWRRSAHNKAERGQDGTRGARHALVSDLTLVAPEPHADTARSARWLAAGQVSKSAVSPQQVLRVSPLGKSSGQVLWASPMRRSRCAPVFAMTPTESARGSHRWKERAFPSSLLKWQPITSGLAG